MSDKIKLPTLLLISCIGLLILAGIYNGVMDTLQFHYAKSVFPQTETETFLGGSRQFWDPEISWRNKYKGGDPVNGSAFWLSKTALVFLTDGWHLFQFLMLSAFQLAVIIPWIYFLKLRWWYALPALLPAKFLFGIGFALMYSWVLVEQQKNTDQSTLKQQ